MTFDDLISFSTLYKYKNFSNAAVELKMTQSALSKRIKSIQVELQVQLISTDNRRKLLITESGEVFYKYAQALLSQYQLLKNDLNDLKTLKKGTLHIASVPVLSQYGILDKTREFMEQFPQINIRISELEGTELISKIQSDNFDLGIIRDFQMNLVDHKVFENIDLETDDLLVILPKDHPLAKEQTIDVSSLSDFDIVTLNPGSGVYEKITEIYQQARLVPNIRFSTTHIESLLSIINNSNMITFLFAKSVQPFLDSRFVVRQFTEKQTSTLKILFKRRGQNDLQRRFIQYIQNNK